MTEFTFTLPIPPGSTVTGDRYGAGAPIIYGRRRVATVTDVSVGLDDDGMIVATVTAETSPSVSDFAALLDRGATDHLSLPQENP